MTSLLSKIYHEIGLKSLVDSPRDTKVLCLQRCVRLAAYGASTLILTLFLIDLGNTESQTGLFMTLTLAGDVFISLILTVVADKIGRRRTLAFGSLLMTGSGIVFAIFDNFWILLLASVLGVISPSGNEIGPFKAIEESTISQLVGSEDRSSVLAWYTLCGTAGVALGTISCGLITAFLREKEGWISTDAYKLIFYIYAGLGALQFFLCLFLTKACEVEQQTVTPEADALDEQDERRPLLPNGLQHEEQIHKSLEPKSVLKNLLPELSQRTGALIVKLGLLFALDSLASGLSPASWVIYFFHTKFGFKEKQLGELFLVTSILSSISNLVASSLARRIGLVKTMVFTHIPAAISLALIPLPDNAFVAMALLAFRSSTNSMDQAPRQAFLAAAVLPVERTTVMGIINVIKTLSQSVGPVLTGILAGSGQFWIAFVVAGALKIVYDALLLGMFVGYRTIEDEAQAQVQQSCEEEEGEDGVEEQDRAG